MKSVLLLLAVGLLVFPLAAQENSGLEVSVDLTANFQKQTTGHGTTVGPSLITGQGVTDTSSDAAGVLINYRHNLKKWGSLEANYDFTRFTQYYSLLGVEPAVADQTRANAHEFTVAYVRTLGTYTRVRIRPFVEGGGGGLFFAPRASGSNVSGQSQWRAVFLLGGGAEWRATQRISLRIGYRELLYRAPDFSITSQFTNARTSMVEPYAGLVFHL